MGIGAPEIVGLVIIVLILFGGKKIPELAKGLGSGIKNFKKAVKDDDEAKEVTKTDSASKIEDNKTEVKSEDVKDTTKTV